MIKRAILYARVSSDDTGKDGRNLAGQLDMCREYAERQGWQVVAELAEDERGVSGARMDAPQPVSYTHLRAHETVLDIVCRLLLEKKKMRTAPHDFLYQRYTTTQNQQ